MREADAVLDSSDTTSSISEARSKIAKGIHIVENRQKLIKLANISDGGWTTVNEINETVLMMILTTRNV